MFKIGKFEVYFKHYPDEVGEVEALITGQKLPYYGRTECTITENDECIRDGSGYCGLNDRFNKVTGRKVALARALEGASKKFRTLIWNEYIKTARKV